MRSGFLGWHPCHMSLYTIYRHCISYLLYVHRRRSITALNRCSIRRFYLVLHVQVHGLGHKNNDKAKQTLAVE